MNNKEDCEDIILDITSKVLNEETTLGEYICLPTTKAQFGSGIPSFREMAQFRTPAREGDIKKFIRVLLLKTFENGMENALAHHDALYIATKVWCLWFIRDKMFIIDEKQQNLHHTYFFDQDKRIIQKCFEKRTAESFETEFRATYIDQAVLDLLGKNRVIDTLYQTIVQDSKSDEEKRHVKVVKILKTCFYDDANNILYIDDRENGYYAITEKQTLHYYNGEHDIFFEFYKDIKGGGYDFHERIFIENVTKGVADCVDFRSFLREYSFDEDELKKEEYVDLIYCNLLSMYFEPEVRPVFKIIGETGSGKTYLMKNSTQFVTHSKNDVAKINQEKPEDLEVTCAHNRMVCWDNVTNISNEMADSMCVISTGGTATKRELYTTNDLSSFDIRSYLWLSTTIAELGLWREDLTERMIHIFMKKLFTKDNKKISAKEISVFHNMQNLNEMFVSLFHHLQKMMGTIRTIRPYEGSRLDDWTRLMKGASLAIGKTEEYMESVLEKEIKMKNLIMAESDKTTEPLYMAVGLGKLILGTWYTTKEILNAMTDLGDDSIITVGKYGTTTRTLANSFRKKKDMYKSIGFIIERSEKLANGVFRWKIISTVHGEDQKSFQDDYEFLLEK